MRKPIDTARHTTPMKVVLLGTASLLLAGCSTEMSRIGGSMFGDTQHTGSVTPSQPVGAGGASMASVGQGHDMGAAPAYGQVVSQPLAAPGQNSGQAQYAAASTGGFGAQAAGQPAAQSGGPGTVLVNNGDTVYSIARRYGIPPNALMQANGISDPNGVSPGQRLVIPTYSASSGSWQAAPGQQQPAQQQPAQRQMAAPAASPQSSGGGSHTVRHGDTVYSIARTYNARPGDIISANNLSSPNNIRVGQTLTVPGASSGGGTMASAQQPQQQSGGQQQPQTLDTTAAMEQKPQKVETPEVMSTSLTPSNGDSQQEQTRAGLPDPASMSSGQFRWPVRGRVIAGFGDSGEGGKNDGINISVPEGTSVRAAENGVVAYAGNELKGYGNLVLIRHSDDWVSAYAHNSEILVKRGDTITRGQVVAKAGASGSVSSPQVHFELRKGSQPVDPLRHLAEN